MKRNKRSKKSQGKKESPGQNQSRPSRDSGVGNDHNSITELDAELREIVNNDSPGSPPQDNTPDNSDLATDSELAELEKELDNEPEENSFKPTDISWTDDLLELEPSNPANLEDIQYGIQELIKQLEVNKVMTDAEQAKLKSLSDNMNKLTSKAIKDLGLSLEKAQEINNALSNGSDLEGMEEMLDEVASNLEQMEDDTIDELIKTEENLDTLQENDIVIAEQIRKLHEHLGVLDENEQKARVSFGTRSKAKKGATKAISAAPYLVPAAKKPAKIAGTALAAISLAKTIRHIKNMRKMLDKTENYEVSDLTEYSIKQKTKKALRKGLAVGQLGYVAKGQSILRGIQKRIKGTKGTERQNNARNLQTMARDGDLEAANLVRELVGSKNMAETLDPTSPKAGLEIIMSKLSST
jgi:hypothetical protein